MVALTTRIGSVELANPIMNAAGTAGTGDELGAYVDPGQLGAFVVKSLSAEPWAGNPAPRAIGTDAGMLNAVGLQNPGVERWIDEDLPGLRARGATVVVSIWGFTVGDYERTAAALRDIDGIAAIEVNISCPNLEDRRQMFGHHPGAARDAVMAASAAGLPLWAKMSPNAGDLAPIVDAVVDGGAEAVTVMNTLMGMVIDVETRRPKLGAGGGGLSGPAVRPVAVRLIHDLRAEYPDLPIVGAGGVARAEHAVELMLAGAQAVQVGTATFADPGAVTTILQDLVSWCSDHAVSDVAELVSAAHR